MTKIAPFLFEPFGNIKKSRLYEKKNVFSRVKECTLLQCFPYRCVGICRLSYFDSVRDYLLSGI